MSQGALHQFLTGAAEGDAITGHALIIRRWLRDLGFNSHLYAQHIHANIEHEVRHLSRYRQGAGEERAIYHHSIGSDVPEFLAARSLRLWLIYHNITPNRFFARSDIKRMELAQLGRDQLGELRQQTERALAVSPYNEQELTAAGYDKTDVLPLPLDPKLYDLPLNEELAARVRQTGPNLLFVGRLAPNKKQEDLVKLLYYYRRFAPEAHLYLVGDRWEIGYDKWVEALAEELGIAAGLTLTGKVSQQDMVTYYKCSDCFISMSEHEGFGLPLLESMTCELPILAYGVTGVPGTLADTGIQFLHKDYEALAELIQLLQEDQALRLRIIALQKERVQVFLEPAVRAQFEQFLREVGLV